MRAAGNTPKKVDRAARTLVPVLQSFDQGLLMAVGATAWMLAAVFGTMARLEALPTELPWRGVILFGLAAALHDFVLGGFTGVYGRTRIVGSFDEVACLVKHTVLVGSIMIVGNIVLLDRAIPAGASIAACVFSLGIVSATRVVWRALRYRSSKVDDDADRLIVFGAGDAGAMIVNALLDEPGGHYLPVAILDDDPKKARLSIRGVPVLGTRDDIAAVAEEVQAETLLIAIGTRPAETIQELVYEAVRCGLEVKVIPRHSDLYGTISVGDIREVTQEDLLGRSEIDVDLEQMAGPIRGRTVLVTGAGGSIGSELCRQVHRLGPANLVMLDRDESALHAVEMSIHGRALLDRRDLVVADIRDADRIVEVFDEWKPDVVFHAAALKHLPLLEMHPEEGVKTNVHGTLNLLRAADTVGVDRFVNVSTDKAADPTSVLGYTKRIAERLTAQYAVDSPGTYVSVRFGNVLGSRGSMLTSFRAQVDAGGPVTVTHPEVTRYFMTVEEAVSLVIQAGAVGNDGEVLVLDMGEPVKIDDVARRLIEASGKDIAIEYTGLRQGEKLHEILLAADEIDSRPAHPRLSHAPVKPLDADGLLELDVTTDLIGTMIGLCANQATRWTPVPIEDVLDLTALEADAPVEYPEPHIRLASPILGDEELMAVKRVFESGFLTNGPETAAFEREFADYHEAEHAVALANGTVALHAMLLACDIGPGDEVIVPSMTFIATATSVVHAGATPVFADIRPDTFNLDPADVEHRITERTKAIMPVHYGGQPADMDEFQAICDRHGLILLEDAAQAHGSSYKGRMAGTLGLAGMFSFTPTKNITTGEGAIVTTNDAALAARLRKMRNHGMSAQYVHDEVGYNWRMTEMQCAIGRVQLQKLPDILATKRENAAYLSERLADIDGITPPVALDDRTHAYMLYTTRVADGRRDELMRSMHMAGIEAKVYFPPVHTQAAFPGSVAADLPATDSVFGEILSFPMHPRLGREDLETAISEVRWGWSASRVVASP